jgi:hypothetical protein
LKTSLDLREIATKAAGDLFTLAGFVTFFIFRGGSALCLLPFALFLSTFLIRPGASSIPVWRRFFLPFASGLLIWPLRIFYWDRGDFFARVQNLLLLAALFALYFLARERRWLIRFLRFFNALTLKKRLLSIFIATELLFVLAAGLLTWRGVALAGDEPHYLAISQSLARDHDLNVFNQYFRGGFREFLDVEQLPAHGTWGKGYKKIYSYHLPGISLTLAPFFFFKLSPPLLYFLVRSYLGLFGALLAVLVYLFCLRLWRSRSLAFFATSVFALTAPVFFYSFHVFPEVQAMLLVLSALYILFFKTKKNGGRCLWAGLLLGATAFWGIKYALFIYPICLGFFAFWLWKKKFRPALLLMVFPLLFQALFFYYLYSAYGNFSPNSVYYGMLSPAGAKELYETILNKITLNMRWETLLDYFFDQRDGLLLYNPFYFFAFPGLLLALKNFKRYRLHLLAALPAVLFILNHAFSTIRPGYCPQGRYLAPVIWALLLFALVYYRESHNRFFRKAVLVLPLYPLFVTSYQTLQPFTLYQPTTHDSLVRAGLMFQNWSNTRIDLPALLPSFIKTDNHGYLPNTIFLLVFLLLVVFSLVPQRLTWRRGPVGPASVLIFAGLFSLCCLFPRLDLSAPRRLPGPRDLPCQVYFNPQPAAGGAETGWMFSGRGRGRMLIETLVPLKVIELGIRNRSGPATLDLDVNLFDARAARLHLPAAGARRILLLQPAYKKIKAHYYYQFELRSIAPGAAAGPAWLLRLAFR